jgi:Tol biopolymer transport system component
MTRRRELAFLGVGVVLLLFYTSVAVRVAPLLLPPAAPTPTPTKPVGRVAHPGDVKGRIAFAIRGDVYVLSGGGYAPLTSDGRAQEPGLSPDGKTLLFKRVEQIDGRRIVDGQVVPAHLTYSNIVSKPVDGGAEKIVVDGLVRSPNGFHGVTWFESPAFAPDGKRLAVVAGEDTGASDLAIYDAETGKRMVPLSEGANLADPSWSPDGKTIAVTSYTLGNTRLLLVSTDGRSVELTITAPGDPYRPSYSPDGKWITYTLRHGDGNDLHAVQLGSGKDVALTSDGKSWNGVFSPDGKQLAFLREHDGVIDLYFMDLGDALGGGGAPKAATKLTNGEGIDGASRPAWGA